MGRTLRTTDLYRHQETHSHNCTSESWLEILNFYIGTLINTQCSETEDVLSSLKNYLRIFCICHSFDIRIEEPYRQTPSDNNAAHGGSGDQITESQFISSQLIRHEHNTLIRMLSFLRTRCRRCAVHCAALLHLAATYLLLPQVHSFRCVLSDASSAAYRGHQHQTWTGAGHGEY